MSIKAGWKLHEGGKTVLKVCGFCTGSGQCSHCAGTGRIRRRKRFAGLTHHTCGACRGDRICRLCEGSGRVESLDPSELVEEIATDPAPSEHTLDWRTRIVLDLLHNKETPEAYCRQHDISQNDLLRWVLDFIKAGDQAVQSSECDPGSATMARIAELQEQLGAIAGELEHLRTGVRQT